MEAIFFAHSQRGRQFRRTRSFRKSPLIAHCSLNCPNRLIAQFLITHYSLLITHYSFPFRTFRTFLNPIELLIANCSLLILEGTPSEQPLRKLRSGGAFRRTGLREAVSFLRFGNLLAGFRAEGRQKSRAPDERCPTVTLWREPISVARFSSPVRESCAVVLSEPLQDAA